MFSQQESAWAVYATVFFAVAIVLAIRCRSNLLLLPFAIFAVLSAIGMVALLARHFHQSVSTIVWADRSPVANQLPVLSLLLFAGLVESQQVFIRHTSAALRHRDFWGSLYSQDMDEKAMFQRKPVARSTSERPWTYWANISLVVAYTILVIAFLCFRIIQSDDEMVSYYRSMACCTSALALLAIINTILIWVNSSLESAKHLRMVRRNRHDTLFLRLAPILFSLAMIGASVDSWLVFGMVQSAHSLPIIGWIALESFLVYLPVVGVLLMCLHVRRLHSLGQQYPAAENRPSYLRQRHYAAQKQRSPQAQQEIAKIVRYLGTDAANQVTVPPHASRTDPTERRV